MPTLVGLPIPSPDSIGLDFDGGAAPSTVERTYNDVSAQFGMGGDYEGWGYAAIDQIHQFVFNITGVSSTTPGNLEIYQGNTDLVASWMGYSFFNEDSDWVVGISSDPSGPGQHKFFSLFDGNDSNPTTDFLGEGTQFDFAANSAVGSFLIRETSVVPVPPSLALMGLALAGLGFRRRKAA